MITIQMAFNLSDWHRFNRRCPEEGNLSRVSLTSMVWIIVQIPYSGKIWRGFKLTNWRYRVKPPNYKTTNMVYNHGWPTSYCEYRRCVLFHLHTHYNMLERRNVKRSSAVMALYKYFSTNLCCLLP